MIINPIFTSVKGSYSGFLMSMSEGLLHCRMSRKHFFGAADEIELKYVNRYVIQVWNFLCLLVRAHS